MADRTPTRFYSGGGANNVQGAGRLSTPSNWGANSARCHRRFSSSTSTSRGTGGSFGPGDIIDAMGMSDLEDSPLSEYALNNYPNQINGSGPTIHRLLEMMETQTTRIDEILSNQQETEQEAIRLEISTLKDNSRVSKIPRKKTVTRVLTDRINTIHESFSSKLKPSESSTSNHNKSIMMSLTKEILDDPDNDFPKNTVILGVKRKYESERRLLKECEKGDSFRVERVKKAKYDRRKQRIYDRRKSVLTEKEKQYFGQLSKEYMSEESDSSDSEAITVHKLPWRSPKLADWMGELDRRYKNKLLKKTCSTPSKPRVTGTVSSSSPPSNAPEWAIDTSWRPSSTDANHSADENSQSETERDGAEIVYSFD